MHNATTGISSAGSKCLPSSVQLKLKNKAVLSSAQLKLKSKAVNALLHGYTISEQM